jgi:hypothetical protein
MKRNLSAHSVARILGATALVLMLAACGNAPVPIPAPPAPGGQPVYGAGLGSCPSVGGAQPVQTSGASQGYYADLPAQNPVSAGDFVMGLFYQRLPTAGYQVENVVGMGAVKIPALTGYFQNGVIPVCVSSNNNSPGLMNVASGGIRIKMTGQLPALPQGSIPGSPIPNGYLYGFQSTQSMGSVEVRVGWTCDAWVVPQGRVIGCIDVISYGYPGGSMSYRAQ